MRSRCSMIEENINNSIAMEWQCCVVWRGAVKAAAKWRGAVLLRSQ